MKLNFLIEGRGNIKEKEKKKNEGSKPNFLMHVIAEQ